MCAQAHKHLSHLGSHQDSKTMTPAAPIDIMQYILTFGTFCKHQLGRPRRSGRRGSFRHHRCRQRRQALSVRQQVVDNDEQHDDDDAANVYFRTSQHLRGARIFRAMIINTIFPTENPRATAQFILWLADMIFIFFFKFIPPPTQHSTH